ncbi:glutaredoxin family protein [Salininema proteolyticum]|uniref:Glutaredoxin family protein n=1 Tax=Salininema proteolyticum TaxID=1607685 RepID=A0ABV8U2B7_9ACTN
MARLTLVTTKDCHLCGEARDQMRRVSEESGEPWEEKDVADDRELLVEYGDRLPVVLLDGREHGYWTVDRERLLKDLSS